MPSFEIGPGSRLDRVGEHPPDNHRRQHLWNKQRQRDMNEEEPDEAGHAEEMDVARALVIAERHSELLELDRLPEHQARPVHEQHAQDGECVEQLLYCVAFAELMVQPDPQEIESFDDDPTRRDGRRVGAEMAREGAVDRVDGDAQEEHPHGGERPEQRCRQSEIVVHALSTFIIAAKGEPDREAQEAEQRLLVIDPPAAAYENHYAQRPGPVRVADPTGMQGDNVWLWARWIHLSSAASILLP